MGWLLVIILFLLAWLWWDGLGAKEIARKRGSQLCEKADVQFLDDTVVQARLRLCRDRNGRVGIYRRFEFEFSTDGDRRYLGHVDMLGNTVLNTYMEPYAIH
jgi:hypothetical protein